MDVHIVSPPASAGRGNVDQRCPQSRLDVAGVALTSSRQNRSRVNQNPTENHHRSR